METINGLNTNGSAIIGTGIAFTIMTAAAVALKFTSKRLTKASYGVDDWLILVTLLIYITAEVLVVKCKNIQRYIRFA